MKGADIYDQQEIRRFAESGETDVAALAKRLRISEECAQSWVDHFNGVEKAAVEVVDEYDMTQQKEQPKASFFTKKRDSSLVEDDGDA